MLWMTLALAAPCEHAAKLTELTEGLDRAEQAVRDLDPPAMQRELVLLSTDVVPCMIEPIPSSVASRFHRMMAIQLHSREQTDAANASVQAAHNLAPETSFPDDVLPADHPLRVSWSSSQAEKLRKVPEPRVGLVAFDGRSGRRRPIGVPTLVQLVDESGLATQTQYLSPREPLPTYPVVPRRRNALIGCGIAGGAVGIGGTVAAVALRDGLKGAAKDPATSGEQLRSRQRLVNGAQAVGLLGFGLGIGCGLGAVIVD